MSARDLGSLIGILLLVTGALCVAAALFSAWMWRR